MVLLFIASLMVAAPLETTLSLAESRPLGLARTYHVQGISLDPKRLYVSSVERSARSGWLFVFDRATLTCQQTCRLAIGNQYHPGGMQLRDARLHLPLAEYRASSSAVLLTIDVTGLDHEEKPQRRLMIHASATLPDHVGGLACDDRGHRYAANWDCKLVREIDPAGNVVREFSNPTGVAYQEIEYHDAHLWCAGNLKGNGPERSLVDVIDLVTKQVVRRYFLAGSRATGGSDFAHEGFTKEGNHLWFLPEDGPHSTLYRFDLPSAE
ncbi:hypothetical protein K2X85_06195 [bacterium]|nr:hypothetical protein [bacterium]